MADLMTEQHRWLGRLAGDWAWTMEAEAPEPGGAPVTDSGTEAVRSLEGVWMMMESRGSTPEGGSATSVMTLGYDTDRQRFVGTFVGSMMTNLWVYEGTLDDAGQVLTLNTEGPSYTEEGKMAKYRDTLEFRGDGHRVQTSSFLHGDGTWRRFMTTHYHRVR